MIKPPVIQRQKLRRLNAFHLSHHHDIRDIMKQNGQVKMGTAPDFSSLFCELIKNLALHKVLADRAAK